MEQESTSPIRKRVIAGAIAIGTVLGAAGVASAVTAQDTTTTDPSAQTGSTVDDETETDETEANETEANETETDEADEADEEHGSRGNEELLTGTTAEQVTAAALEAVPGGTIDRVETDADGAAYEAHMTDADGNQVTATFDDGFALIEVKTGEGRGGHEGRGGKDGGHNETPLTGAQADAVTAAAEAAVPGGTVTKVEQEGDGFEAHVTDADGNEVEVTMDADLAVLDVGAGH